MQRAVNTLCLEVYLVPLTRVNSSASAHKVSNFGRMRVCFFLFCAVLYYYIIIIIIIIIITVIIIITIEICVFNANTVDRDQTPRSASIPFI